MAIRSKITRTQLGDPQNYGTAPGNFGQEGAQALDRFTDGLGRLGAALATRKDKEDELRAKEKLAAHRLQSEEELLQLSTTAKRGTRVDHEAERLWLEKEKFLLASAENENEKNYLRSQLPDLKKNYVLSAVREEFRRNKQYTIEDATQLYETTANFLRTQPNGTDLVGEEFAKMEESIGQLTHLSADERMNLTNSAREIMYEAAIDGAMERDWEGTEKLLKEGKWDEDITPAGKDRLINTARTFQRAEAAAEEKRINKVISDAKAIKTDANKQLATMNNPEGYLTRMEALLQTIPEDRRAELERDIQIMRATRDDGMKFAGLSYNEREKVLMELQTAQDLGQLTPEQIDLQMVFSNIHDDLKKIDYMDLQKYNKFDYVDVWANPALREDQAKTAVAMLGTQISVFTPGEKEDIINKMKTGTDSERLAIVAQFAPHETLSQELLRSLAEGGSRKDMRMTIAMEMAAGGELRVAQRIIQGDRLLSSSGRIGKDTLDALETEMRDSFKGLFPGRPDIRNIYEHAALAYAVTMQEDVEGRPIDVSELSREELSHAMQQILPGQVTGFRGQAILTPNRNVTPEKFSEHLNMLKKDPEWWRKAKWYNPYTEGDGLEFIDGPPMYLGGPNIDPKPIPFGDVQNLKMLSPGLYMLELQNRSGIQGPEGRMLTLDLRDMQ